ncbi:hypothetical protein BJV78DRAFT_335647 [Lactifluus subvellereus]|nr:hypothetical protein BJV78DRAFT_335647 [Lactifluus subvellereus]
MMVEKPTGSTQSAGSISSPWTASCMEKATRDAASSLASGKTTYFGYSWRRSIRLGKKSCCLCCIQHFHYLVANYWVYLVAIVRVKSLLPDRGRTQVGHRGDSTYQRHNPESSGECPNVYHHASIKAHMRYAQVHDDSSNNCRGDRARGLQCSLKISLCES